MRLLTATLMLGLLGCDGVATSDFRGEPLARFQGRITSVAGALPPSDAPFRVAVFWSPSGSTDIQQVTLDEQPSVSVSVSFPDEFTLDIFEPPAASQLLADGSGYALGVVLAYRDLNGDGRYTAGSNPEELVGGAPGRALIYAPAGLSAASSPIGRALVPHAGPAVPV
jgi:hypothetical protein